MEPLFWVERVEPDRRDLVGEKAYSLNLLAQQGYPAIPSSIVSALVWREFWETREWLEPLLAELAVAPLHVNADDPHQLRTIAQQVRRGIIEAEFPSDWLAAIARMLAQWQESMPRLCQGALLCVPSLSLPHVSPAYQNRLASLLASQVCSTRPEDLGLALKRTWAELFRARNLFYWQRSRIALQEVQLAVIVQPLMDTPASGYLRECEGGTWDIEAIWGLPTAVMFDKVIPDVYRVDATTGEIVHRRLGCKAWSDRLADVEPSSEPMVETLETSLEVLVQTRLVNEPQQNQYVLNSEQVAELIRLGQQVKEFLIGTSNLVLPEQTPPIHPGSTPRFAPPNTGIQLEWAIATAPEEPARFWLSQAYVFGCVVPAHELAEEASRNRMPAKPILHGLGASVGTAIAQAWVVSDVAFDVIPAVLSDAHALPPPGFLHTQEQFTKTILVIPNLTPDLLPLLPPLAGVIAEQGGMNSHGAIVARELGIPAVVGATNATRLIHSGDWVRLDGDRGIVYRALPGESEASLVGDRSLNSRPPARDPISQERYANALPQADLENPGKISSDPADAFSDPTYPIGTKLMVNLSQPQRAEAIAHLPVDGVGLVRSEFLLLGILENYHPYQWLQWGREQELLERLMDTIARLARPFAPRPVFYRSLDWRAEEFATLKGAPPSEPVANPALGLRGTLSYLRDPGFFDVELAALAQLRRTGQINLHLMLPFVRSLEEFLFCRQRVEQAGLTHAQQFQLWIVAEVPSVLFLLPDYVRAGVQGIAIGTNDLTQLLLGVDRDWHSDYPILDERHPAVRQAMRQLIETSQHLGIPCSICGQAPVRDPDIIERSIEWGVSAISVEPEAIAATYRAIARAERRLLLADMRHSGDPEKSRDFPNQS